MNTKITLAQQAVDTAIAAHPSNFFRAQEHLLTILPAAAVTAEGFSVHDMDDGSAVEVWGEWFCAKD